MARADCRGVEMIVEVYTPPTLEKPSFERIWTTGRAQPISRDDKFFAYGTFSISIPFDFKEAQAFQKYNLVRIDNAYWGVIRGMSLSASGNSDTLAVKGIGLKGLTSSRITIAPGFSGYEGTQGYDAAMGATETVMKHFVQSNFFPAGSPTRQLPGFVLAPDLGRGNPNDKYKSRDERLSDVLKKLGEGAQIGYEITPNLEDNTLVFDVVEGVDRSASQRERPAVIFSPGLGSVQAQSYVDDDSDMRNVFYSTMSGYEFADEAYTAVYTRNDEPLPSGLYRWEQPLSISVNTPEAGQEYAEIKRLAMISAVDYEGEQSFSCDISGSRFVYGEDYNLGDIVTVRNENWGVSMDVRLVAMNISANSSGIAYKAEFGKAPLTLGEKIRRYAKNSR